MSDAFFESDSVSAPQPPSSVAQAPLSLEAVSSKRKREAPSAPNPYIPLTEAQLEKKFFHLRKSLLAAGKKAQTFETQRLIKKIAQLKKKAGDNASTAEIDELSAQLATLKSLSLPPIVLINLHSKLTRIHLFVNNPVLNTLPSLTLPTESTSSSHDPQSSKVANRVLSSKPFASEMNASVNKVKGWMDPEFREGEKEKDKARKKEEARIEREKEKAIGRGKGAGGGAALADPTASAEGRDALGEESEGKGLVSILFDGDVSSGSEGGGSEDEEDGEDDDGASVASWSSGSVASVGPSSRQQPSSISNRSKTLKRSSRSSSASSSFSTRPPPTKKAKPTLTAAELNTANQKKAAAEKKKKEKAKVSTSTFLPSLSAGYVFGGSDSEPEALSDDEAGARKNRRGQRARKAIWEKKYGQNANHLKARTAQFSEATRGRGLSSGKPVVSHGDSGTRYRLASRGKDLGPQPGRVGPGRGTFQPPSGFGDGGWKGVGEGSGALASPGEGATAGGRGGFSGRGGRGGGSAGSLGRVPDGDARPPGKKAEDKGMHPSWVAKQKQKEMMAGVAPKGKKVVFD